MSLTEIPGYERTELSKIIIQAFNYKKDIKIANETYTSRFITPRVGYQYGFEISKPVSEVRNAVIRTYFNFDPLI